MVMTKIQKISLSFYIILFLWFSLVFIEIPKLLIEGDIGFINLSGLLELFLVIILVGYFLKWKYTDFLNLFVLSVWGYMQYISHWKYMCFKPSQEIIERYYQFFDGTLRIFAESNVRIIPDLYHMILGLLILINLVIVIFKIIVFFKNFRQNKGTSTNT